MLYANYYRNQSLENEEFDDDEISVAIGFLMSSADLDILSPVSITDNNGSVIKTENELWDSV